MALLCSLHFFSSSYGIIEAIITALIFCALLLPPLSVLIYPVTSPSFPSRSCSIFAYLNVLSFLSCFSCSTSLIFLCSSLTFLPAFLFLPSLIAYLNLTSPSFFSLLLFVCDLLSMLIFSWFLLLYRRLTPLSAPSFDFPCRRLFTTLLKVLLQRELLTYLFSFFPFFLDLPSIVFL